MKVFKRWKALDYCLYAKQEKNLHKGCNSRPPAWEACAFNYVPALQNNYTTSLISILQPSEAFYLPKPYYCFRRKETKHYRDKE